MRSDGRVKWETLLRLSNIGLPISQKIAPFGRTALRIYMFMSAPSRQKILQFLAIQQTAFAKIVGRAARTVRTRSLLPGQE